MASPGTKDQPNIYRLVFFSPSIIFILRSRATVPPPLSIASRRLHVPLPSLAISASGPAHASPICARRLDPDPPPSSSPLPRSDRGLIAVIDPRPLSERSLSPVPRARTPHRALVVPFTGALIVVPFVRALVVVPVASSSSRDHLRPFSSSSTLVVLVSVLILIVDLIKTSGHRACVARHAIYELRCVYIYL